MSDTTHTLGIDEETEGVDYEEQEVPFKVPEGYRVLTDEEAEKLTTTLVEDHREKWEVQEIVDNAVVAGSFNNLMRNEFYYEFKGAHGMVRGLTSAMISHLATAQGITEMTEERQYEKTETDHEFEVVVAMPDPMNPDNQLKRTGFSEEPIMMNGKKDRFAKQKAHTKAFRNACLKLLPQDLLIATTYKLAKLVPVDWTPEQQGLLPPAEQTPQPQQQATPQPQQAEQLKPAEDTPRARAMRRMFAVFREHEENLAELGIDSESFWTGVKEQYKVESRKDMTEAQLKNVASSLEYVRDDGLMYSSWIQDLIPESEETEGDAESDDAIPF